MYRFLLSFCTVIALFYLTSCREVTVRGSGETKTEQRTVAADFNKVEFELPVDATIQVMPGSTPNIQLGGYANILKYVTVKVKDGKLVISADRDVNLSTDKRLKATIVLPSLTGLDVVGSSEVMVGGTITGTAFKAELDGSGEITIEQVQLEALAIDINGSGKVAVNAGNTNRARYEISGSGKVFALELVHAAADIDIAGSGYVELTATQKLDVAIAGSGDVKYKGGASVNKDIAGSGSVDALD
jgi:hypothetical protein